VVLLWNCYGIAVGLCDGFSVGLMLSCRGIAVRLLGCCCEIAVVLLRDPCGMAVPVVCWGIAVGFL